MSPTLHNLSRGYALSGATLCFAAVTSLSACGFQPLYETATVDGTGGKSTVGPRLELGGIAGPDRLAQVIENAFAESTAAGTGGRYRVDLSARETAQPLAVQIDATVTRFTYQILGQYRVADKVTGEVVQGSARSQASFNVVRSAYSTLAAEQTARSKAARQLIAQIERDALIKLSRRSADEKFSDEELVSDDPAAAILRSPTPREDFSVEEFVEDQNDVWREYSRDAITDEPPLDDGIDRIGDVPETDRLNDN
jgi:LPS-assembly lipoprotein